MRSTYRLFAIGTALAPAAACAVFLTGALDPTFGTGGKVNMIGVGLAVQADGKIVALGGASVNANFFNVTGSFALARLTSTGAVDFSRSDVVGSCVFCVAGRAGTYATRLQADGAIVSVGFFEQTGANTGACKNASFVAMRHLANGSPDPAFGTGGIAHIGFGEGRAFAIQADGKIVIAGGQLNYGCLTPDGLPQHSVARMTSTGGADLPFGTNGVVATTVGPGPSFANAVAVRPDGKVLVAGFAIATPIANQNITLGTYSATGVLEEMVALDPGTGGNSVAYAMALQPDGKFVVGGSAAANFALLRFTSPGVYDATFGSGGKIIGPGAPVKALALQPDGKIVAAMSDGDVLRFDSAGLQDRSFGIAGRVSTGMSDVVAVALQPDGKVVVGSSTQVARIDPNAVTPINPAPSVLDFLGQSLHTTSLPQPVTITNTTGVPQTISSITATTGFEVTHDCASLASLATCTAMVTYTPVVEGPNAGDLVISSSAGTHKAYLLGTGEKTLTTHYYRSILRRAPDAPGKAFWDSEAVRMQSIGANVNEAWFAMAQQFFTSAEYAGFFRDEGGFITDLYKTFFNRAPDSGGLAFWMGQLVAGMPREVMLASFMFSPEFAGFTQGIFGNTAARAEVDVVMDFYRGLLGRLPDPAGFAYWVAQFRAAQCQGAGDVYAAVESISSQFANGAEYFGKNRTTTQYTGDLYNAFLRRGGDVEGVQYWVGQLHVLTRDGVRQNFIASAEFQGRVNAIVNQGCMP